MVNPTLMRKAISMEPTPQSSGGSVELAEWDPPGAHVELPMVRADRRRSGQGRDGAEGK